MKNRMRTWLPQIVIIFAIFWASESRLASGEPLTPIPVGSAWLTPTSSDAQAAGRAVARLASLRDGGSDLISIANGATLAALHPTDRVRLAHALVKLADQPSAARGLSRIVDLINLRDEASVYAAEVALVGLANAHTKESVGILLRAARSSARDKVTEVWAAWPPRDPSWLVDSTPQPLVIAAARAGDLRALEWLAMRLPRLSGDVLAEALTAMAELGDERALEPAKKALTAAPQVQTAAVMVLIAFKTRDAGAQLKLLAQSVATRAAAFDLARRARSRGILPFALQIDPAEDTPIIERRIAYLAAMGGLEATNAIGKYLSHERLPDREIAARALAAQGTRHSTDALARAAMSKAPVEKRREAFYGYALHRQKGGEIQPAIEGELRRLLISSQEDERALAVRALGESGGELPWDALVSDKSPTVRAHLAIALSKRGPLSALRALDKEKRADALAALALEAQVLRDEPDLSLRAMRGIPISILSTYWTVRHGTRTPCSLTSADAMFRSVRIGTVLGCIANGSTQAKWELLEHLPVEPDPRLRFAILKATRGEPAWDAAIQFAATRDPDRAIRTWAKFGTRPIDRRPTVESVGDLHVLSLSFDGLELAPMLVPSSAGRPPAQPVLDEPHEEG